VIGAHWSLAVTHSTPPSYAMPGPSIPPLVSIVIPLWNEEETIAPMLARVLALVRAEAEARWELVFVNDGSRDATQERLLGAAEQFPAWKLVQLSRNFGQQAAYRAGLEHASGDAVVFLDADLQDPPEMIPEMIRLWRDGAKLVVGQRRSRAETGFRRFCFDLFHTIFHRMTQGAMPKNSGTFGLMDRVIVEQLRRMPELNVFLPALRCWVGFRQEVVWYDRAVREGEPKQSFAKLLRYAWNGITSFSVLPLKAISLLGLLISLGGIAYGFLLLGIKLLQLAGFFPELVVQGFTTLAVAIFSLGGIQLLCLGIIGEYLARIYDEVKRRPPYIVEQVFEGGAAR
jgi:polyisoprenyl-phosphate glycosyltransferase